MVAPQVLVQFGLWAQQDFLFITGVHPLTVAGRDLQRLTTEENLKEEEAYFQRLEGICPFH